MEVAEFLCSYRRVFVPLRKSRFFVIYFRGETLADGKSLPLTREVDFAKQKTEGEKSLPQSPLVSAPSSEGAVTHCNHIRFVL